VPKKETINKKTALDIPVRLSHWEIEHIIERLEAEKFPLDVEEDRILVRTLRDRLKEKARDIDSKLAGFENLPLIPPDEPDEDEDEEDDT